MHYYFDGLLRLPSVFLVQISVLHINIYHSTMLCFCYHVFMLLICTMSH